MPWGLVCFLFFLSKQGVVLRKQRLLQGQKLQSIRLDLTPNPPKQKIKWGPVRDIQSTMNVLPSPPLGTSAGVISLSGFSKDL